MESPHSQGVQAGNRSVTLSSNPYDAGTDEHQDWTRGWIHGQSAYRHAMGTYGASWEERHRAAADVRREYGSIDPVERILAEAQAEGDREYEEKRARKMREARIVAEAFQNGGPVERGYRLVDQPIISQATIDSLRDYSTICNTWQCPACRGTTLDPSGGRPCNLCNGTGQLAAEMRVVCVPLADGTMRWEPSGELIVSWKGNPAPFTPFTDITDA